MPKKRNDKLEPGDKVTIVREVVEVRKTRDAVTVIWDDGSQTAMAAGIELESIDAATIPTPPPIVPTPPMPGGQGPNR